MLNMTKKQIVFTGLFVGIPVILFFQNCSKSANSNLPSAASLGLVHNSDSLVIVPPSANDQININQPPSGADSISSEKGSIGPCDQIVVSDILLNIKSISSQAESPNEVSFEILDSDKSISLEKLTLKIKAKKSEIVRNLVINLNAQGNKLLTTSNVVVDVRPPTDEQSIVQVALLKEYTLVAGQNYTLILTVNPNKLIAANNNACIFKPLIQSADLNSDF